MINASPSTVETAGYIVDTAIVKHILCPLSIGRSTSKRHLITGLCSALQHKLENKRNYRQQDTMTDRSTNQVSERRRRALTEAASPPVAGPVDDFVLAASGLFFQNRALNKKA